MKVCCRYMPCSLKSWIKHVSIDIADEKIFPCCFLTHYCLNNSIQFYYCINSRHPRKGTVMTRDTGDNDTMTNMYSTFNKIHIYVQGTVQQYIYIYIYIYTHVYIHTYTETHIYTDVFIHIYTHILYIYIYIYIYTHIYMHTHSRGPHFAEDIFKNSFWMKMCIFHQI